MSETESGCDCIKLMNEALEQHNAKLDVPPIVDMKTGKLSGDFRVTVNCFKIDSKKRGRLPTLLAHFCPFCGARYPEAPP